MTIDEKYMRLSLRLSRKGKGKTSPNPLVGTVIVKKEEIVGKGYHKQAGEPHAEINALKEAGERAKDAVLYVNLEPCCHYGRTPPCTESIIQAGIKEVVIALKDPNPYVNGKGIREIRLAGIKVRSGILEKEAQKLNEVYLKYITTGEPFVILKSALTLDGKMATHSGSSKWITGEKAREYAHCLRKEVDGILVGIETVLKDNPHLTVKGKKLTKIIVDSKARIPLTANVLNHSTVVATTKLAPEKKIRDLEKRGVKVLIIEEKKNKVNLKKLVQELGKRQITSLIVEGGSAINTSFLKENLVDKILFFFAPKIVGGTKFSIGELGIDKIKDALSLSRVTFKKFDSDILVTGYPKKVYS